MENYYDKNSEAYIENTFYCDMDELYKPFLKYLDKGDSILDAGCGSARDSLNFIKRGYSVSAFDNSQKMVDFANSHTNINVEKKSFLDLDYKEEFDGIWACASLLHVDRYNLPLAFTNLHAALKSDGILYCSFKCRAYDFSTEDRTFTCFTKSSFKTFMDELSLFNILEIFISHDSRENRDNELWLNAILKKTSGF
jgi:SAM-dependent methyltransferase